MMEPIIITKERNTLTITVTGATWTVDNLIRAGKHAGKTLTRTNRTNSKERAIAQAKYHAKVNGWTE